MARGRARWWVLLSLAVALAGCGSSASGVAGTSGSVTASSAASGPSSSGESSAQPLVGAAQAVVGQFPIDVTYIGQGQIITVAVADPSATTGTLTGWQAGPDGFTAVIGPVAAFVGSSGVGQVSEGSRRTPVGTYGLTEGFGLQPNPGTRIGYFQAGLADWWVSDIGSSLYNTHQVCDAGSCPFDTSVSEQLGTIDPEYRYAVVIDYNRSSPAAGAGSAFFLHVQNGVPTAGCVSVDESVMLQILGWLDPAQGPSIAIGVG